MLKRMTIFLLCFTIAVVGFYKVASAAYSEGVVKECEKLKSLKNENKDMPASVPGIKEITGDQLKKMIDEKKKIVIMDNRPKAEYDKEHIAGAVLVPVDDLMKDSKVVDKYNKNDIVVNY
jgi:predicted sulfurtransferase